MQIFYGKFTSVSRLSFSSFISILQFHLSEFEGGPNVTMFCTYKPKKCLLSEVGKKDQKGRWIWWIPVIFVAWLGFLEAQSRSVKNPTGTNDDQMYCIANDWRSRDRKAEEFQTFTNCRFSMPMAIRGKIPFGTMYCTYTSSYCTKLGHYLDNEQLAWNVVKAIKRKDNSIRTQDEKKVLEKVEKMKNRSTKREILKEIAKKLNNKD